MRWLLLVDSILIVVCTMVVAALRTLRQTEDV